MTDPIANMFSQVKSAYQARKQAAELPYSAAKEAIAKVMVQTGFLDSVKVLPASKPQRPFKLLQLKLRYIERQPALSMIKRISKPGNRVYRQAKKLHRINYGLGISILSTSAGIMSGKDAKKKNLGGEVIGEMW